MVAPPPMQVMITIDYYDGNRFLARQPRQSGSPSKTPPGATFTQQPGSDAAKARIQQRHLRNTRIEIRKPSGRDPSVDSPLRACRRPPPVAHASATAEMSFADEAVGGLYGDRQWPRIVVAAPRARSERRVLHPQAFPACRPCSPAGNRSDTARQVAVLRYPAGCDLQSVGRGIPSLAISYGSCRESGADPALGEPGPATARDRLSLNFGVCPSERPETGDARTTTAISATLRLHYPSVLCRSAIASGGACCSRCEIVAIPEQRAGSGYAPV